MEPPVVAEAPVQKRGGAWIFLIGLVLFIVAGIFIAKTKPHLTAHSSDMYSSQYNSAKVAYLAGDTQGTIDRFTTLVRTAPSKELEGKAKLILASGYLNRNQSGDQAQAMKLFKDVISDYAVPAYVRALSINSIARVVQNHPLSFYQLYFPEDPYRSYIPQSGDDTSKIQEIYLRLLELSDKTSPNSYAEYLMAGSYYAPKIGQFIVNNVSTTNPALQNIALQAQKEIQAGDAKTDSQNYFYGLLIEAYLNRATGMSASEGVLNTISISTREEAYKKVFSLIDTLSSTDKANPVVTAQLFRARFFYADFLMRYVGESRYSDIRTILKPFGGAAPKNILPSSTYVTMEAKKLVQISPEFKAYLDATGNSSPAL